MGLSRRRFLAASAAATAAVCVGCTDDADHGAALDDAVDRDGDGDGFGGGIGIGSVDDVREAITAGGGAMYVAEARSWVVPGAGNALLALHQRCTHRGCRVPWCATSKRFECPCHGSVFNRVGELVDGPARRGLDRFPVRVEGEAVVIDTREVVHGSPPGHLTVDGEAAGPVCVGLGAVAPR